MVYLLKMVIFHGYVSHNQMVCPYVSHGVHWWSTESSFSHGSKPNTAASWPKLHIQSLSFQKSIDFIGFDTSWFETISHLNLPSGKLSHNYGKSPCH